jgi:hypothetical protein
MSEEVAPPCSSCGSTDVLPILYGMPESDVKGTMLAPRPDDDVALGGCRVSPELPAWRCRACRHDFGRLDERAPEMFTSEGDDDV